MLVEQTLFGVVDKVQIAVERIKAFEPPDGYFLAFSGGKDSQCIYHLAKEADVKFDAHFHLTSVDPPEVISFVKTHYPEVILDQPPESMWRLIERKKIPPTRKIRYCYSKRKIMLNNDNDEARRLFESCQLKGKHILNPIVDWLTEDVWEYLNGNGIPHCCLYDEGFHRIGCIGCPMSREKGMLREFERWPKYYAAYLRAFDRMLVARRESGLDCSFWPDAQAVMDWWIYGRKKIEWERDQYEIELLL